MFINARVTRTFIFRYSCLDCGDVRNAEVTAGGAGNGPSRDEAAAAAVADAREIAEQTLGLVQCPACQSPSHLTAQFKRHAFKQAASISITGSTLVTGFSWIASLMKGDALSPRGAAITFGASAVALLLASAWSTSRPFRGISSRVRWIPQ